MIEYLVLRDCWWNDTLWKKDQKVVFDKSVEPPKEHFEKIREIKPKKTAANNKKNDED